MMSHFSHNCRAAFMIPPSLLVIVVLIDCLLFLVSKFLFVTPAQISINIYIYMYVYTHA